MLFYAFDFNYDKYIINLKNRKITSTDLFQVTKIGVSQVIQKDLFSITELIRDKNTLITIDDLCEYFKTNKSSIILTLKRHTTPNFVSECHISLLEDPNIFKNELDHNNLIEFINYFINASGSVNRKDLLMCLDSNNIGLDRKHREKYILLN